jgi:peptide/nickel transport system ATP-binding protein
MSVLEVRGLRVELAASGHDIVDEVSFDVEAGELLGLVGESGSGKTTVGLALLGHARRGARIAGGEVRIAGRNVLRAPAAEQRSMRGRLISYVPQDPSAALNPALRIVTQLEETLRLGDVGSRRIRKDRMLQMLDEVSLPTDERFLRRYIHELSGGQQQRVALAMAFACRPQVIVLDEPTTGLDVSTQARVIDTVRELCDIHEVAGLYISHDLAVVASLCSRVAVMYAGRLVEIGPRGAVFGRSAHPYSRTLMDAVPVLSGLRAPAKPGGAAPAPGRRPHGCFFAARCSFAVERCKQTFPSGVEVSDAHIVRCFQYEDVVRVHPPRRLVADGNGRARGESSLLEVRGVTASYGSYQALFEIDLAVRRHQCVALVGESGSGKTTLGRCIAGLHDSYSGEILFAGRPLPPGARSRDRETRQRIQYIFQSPYNSLNPRKTVGEIVAQPVRLFFDIGRREAHDNVLEALGRVALPSSIAARYPDELSGGERQRVAVARGLAARPDLLVCDEITSALDVSVQAEIIDLLVRLQHETGVGLLFITHNLALIRALAQEVTVMHAGRIVERGTVDEVLESPQAVYTKKLLSDTPDIEPTISAAAT